MNQLPKKKETPAKVTHEATRYRDATCPRCKNVVSEIYCFADGSKELIVVDYCKYCGQHLSWEGFSPDYPAPAAKKL